MNALIILLLLAGLGGTVWLTKTKKATAGLTGVLVTGLVVIAGFSLSRSCRPDAEYMADKKVEVFEAVGWKTATLINEHVDAKTKVLLLRPKAAPSRTSFTPPYIAIEAGLLAAIDHPGRVMKYDVVLPEGVMEGIPVDQISAAIKAHPSAGVLVSLIGPPDKAEGTDEVNPGKLPFYAACRLETPRLRQLANSGILTAALVPVQMSNWYEEAPDNTPEAVFNAYCTVYDGKP